jgi:O-antigen ligase
MLQTRSSSKSFARKLDFAIEAVLIALLAYLPFALGGVFAISHVVLMVGAAVMGLCFALRCLVDRESDVVWTWGFVPIVLFLGLVAFQLLPLDADVLASWAPGSAEIWRELGGAPERATISLYPWATRVDLHLLLAVSLIILVVSNVYREAAALKRLLLALAVIGLAAALLALMQDITSATAIFWTYKPGGAGVTGGPFVHRGHFAEFTNLSMGAGLALLLVRAVERRPGRQLRLGPQPGMGRVDRLMIAFLVLGILAIAMSQARNGLLSLLLGAALVAALMHQTRFVLGIGWPLIGMLMAGFVGLMFLGLDPVYDRMATLGDPGDAYGGRAALVRDSLAMLRRFPWFGGGQGAYEIVFPMFDESMRAGTAAHAENQYAEILAETGWVGAGLIGLLVLLVVRSWWRLAMDRSRRSGLTRAVAFGLGFGLFAMAMHSTTDFGIKLPALMTLVGVLVAVLLGLAAQRTSSRATARGASALFALGLAALLVAMLPDALAARQAERVWDQKTELEARLAELPVAERVTGYDELIQLANAAAALQPNKIEYRYWAVLYDWNRAYDAEDVKTPSDERVWLEPTPQISAAAAKTQAALVEAAQVAPTFGSLWSVVGQLGVRWLADEEAARWILLGQDLAPHNPAACVAAAAELLREGKDTEALPMFTRATEMGANARVILDILVKDLGRFEFAANFVQGDLGLMMHLENLLQGFPEEAERLTALTETINTIVEEASSEPDPTPWMLLRLASLRVEQGRDPEAIALFRRVLLRRPDNGCRYPLAEALLRESKIPEARMQLRDLLNVHPEHAAAERLLEGLLEGLLDR